VTAARSVWVVATILLAARPVFADGSAADEAFKKGRELLKSGKYAAACAEFEHSQELDPALGTLFNIAECDEKIGKLASALAAYREVVSRDTKPERRQVASDAATRLSARVPKLVVKVPAAAKHATISLGGKRAIDPNTPVEVDLGRYVVEVHADGMKPYTTKVTIADEGKTVTVTAKLVVDKSLPKLEPDHADHVDHEVARHDHAADGPSDEPAPRSHRKTLAIAVIAAGGAALVTGGVYGGLASSSWNDAKAVCGGTTCTTQTDLDRAAALGDQARSKANISTGLVVAGGVVAALGVVLWVTAPSEHAVAVAAHAGPDGGTVTITGRF
jgi:PEGA domain